MSNFSVGDVVVSKDANYMLRHGEQRYAHAVVARVNPLVLVSEEADAVWNSNIKPKKLRKHSTAPADVLADCMSIL